MPRLKILLYTSLAMLAFAGNSLLCRIALRQTGIDAASFSAIRICSGALVLWLIVHRRAGSAAPDGSWLSGLALFVYAAAFSFAYVSLPVASGALILFGAVQATMIGYGLWRGERLSLRQTLGLLLAAGGVVALMLPGWSPPPLQGALLMALAGVGWGVYSLRAAGIADPLAATAGNFARAAPFVLLLNLVLLPSASLDGIGVAYGLASGALASGLGYVVWYAVLRELTATSAATVQLSVPVLAAFGGILFLGEAISLHLIATSAAILGGIALVTLKTRRPKGEEDAAIRRRRD
ncbi:MAG: DMT family transporter [Burkholderiaceae bacterium]